MISCFTSIISSTGALRSSSSTSPSSVCSFSSFTSCSGRGSTIGAASVAPAGSHYHRHINFSLATVLYFASQQPTCYCRGPCFNFQLFTRHSSWLNPEITFEIITRSLDLLHDVNSECIPWCYVDGLHWSTHYRKNTRQTINNCMGLK